MQYTDLSEAVKIENFQKKFDAFLDFAQNIDCLYMSEPPRRGGSNEYPQSMFWSKNKKKKNPSPSHHSQYTLRTMASIFTWYPVTIIIKAEYKERFASRIV